MKLVSLIILISVILLILIPISTSTILVNNATTSGWTSANISLNGSRWTNDGSLANGQRNDTSLNISEQSLYASCDETQGIIIHNVNTATGLINLTNQGDWTGNASLNYSNGIIGNACSFNGINDKVSIPNHDSLKLNTVGTVSAWFYANGSQATWVPIVSMWLYDGGARTGYALQFETSNTLSFFSRNVRAQTTDAMINKWVHVAGVYNGTHLILYINGTYVTSTALSDGMQTGTALFMIGSWSTYYFKGSIDEVKVWKTALSASEIAVLYNTSLKAQAMPLILNQTVTTGYVINSSCITFSDNNSNNNESSYGRQNGTTSWGLIQSNAVSGTCYEHPVGLQFNSMDFGILMQGNGSNTTFFSQLQWNEKLATSTSTITIPANSWGMFNNWSTNTNFLNIAANESNDVAYTTYNVTSGEWDSYYPGYSWNSAYAVNKNNSVMSFFNAQTNIVANTQTPQNTSITTGWNMLYLMGTTNRTISDICTNMAVCTDIYYYNSTTNTYVNTGTDTIQPNQGFLAYTNSSTTWMRTTI